jgi:hypothetical protein
MERYEKVNPKGAKLARRKFSISALSFSINKGAVVG